ncbi:uncharacterized protein EI90DRAFT_172047 [Cantharellus anzutake]|uniref:uncharacterized protein n=1 Tax=Cantharellus anzutake TaxID=1750568 RepID=UPI001908238D|nr:uncharacterized protein EI90DRAFT_172047 [Cantharellus anzutake]KAF8336407.1 hypothetical protein EI90DRAFT_172047 [Cantharellus anzutake]
MVMEAKLPDSSEEADSWGVEIDYDAQFNDPDVRNGIVTCAALSLDGHHIALGFGSGVIELADIDHQCTISRFQLDPPNHPVWIEFVHGSHRVAAEDNEGNVTILSHDTTPINLGTLPNGPLPAVTRVSDNGLFIIRVPRDTDNSWYDNMTLVSILGDPHMQLLASPPESDSLAIIHRHKPAIPHRRTLGFSPGARFIGAFDGLSAFTWSTDLVTDSHQSSKTDAVDNLDESWIKCPFYVISQSTKEEKEEGLRRESDIRSFAAGRTPLFGTGIKRTGLPMFFNGKLEFVIPKEYRPVVSSHAKALGPAKMGLEFSSKAGRQLQLLLILAKSFRMSVVNCVFTLRARSTHYQGGGNLRPFLPCTVI